MEKKINISSKIRKYENIMVDIGTGLFKLNIILDTLIKELLNSLDDSCFDFAISFPYFDNTIYRILTGIRIYWDFNTRKAMIVTKEMNAISWNDLCISTKDMIANTIILELAANDVYKTLHKH